MQRVSRIPPEFKVDMPDDLIALHPADERDQSRLMVLDCSKGEIVHIGRFRDIDDFLSNNLIVVNNTRVLPARVYGTRHGGGKVEVTFVLNEESASDLIHVLVTPTHRLKQGMDLYLPGGASFRLDERANTRGWLGRWRCDNEEDLPTWLQKHGVVPLPPYIKRKAEDQDMERYQTVYAETASSMAAPTAGLHFTPDLMHALEAKDNQIAQITLDVGMGTFVPIITEDLAKHIMQRETFYISKDTADQINRAKESGRRVTAVGTTSVRALETAAAEGKGVIAGEKAAELFIRPPYKFMVVDNLVTNFHRADSTLMQLVASLAGWDMINEAYTTAVRERFRLYSYGDAMLILT